MLDHELKKRSFRNNQKLHLKYGNEHYEYLYILPSRWVCLLHFETIGEEIHENLQNAYCMPLEYFVEKHFDIWDPEIHSPREYLQSFYLASLIQKCGEKSIIHLQIFVMVFEKWTRSSYNDIMNNVTSSSSSDYES